MFIINTDYIKIGRYKFHMLDVTIIVKSQGYKILKRLSFNFLSLEVDTYTSLWLKLLKFVSKRNVNLNSEFL